MASSKYDNAEQTSANRFFVWKFGPHVAFFCTTYQGHLCFVFLNRFSASRLICSSWVECIVFEQTNGKYQMYSFYVAGYFADFWYILLKKYKSFTLDGRYYYLPCAMCWEFVLIRHVSYLYEKSIFVVHVQISWQLMTKVYFKKSFFFLHFKYKCHCYVRYQTCRAIRWWIPHSKYRSRDES